MKIFTVLSATELAAGTYK